MNRDIRTLNNTEGQKIESQEVLKKIGDLSYRNFGTLARMGLFNEGKALITSGLEVVESSGMAVSIPSGAVFQRFLDVIPCVQTSAQTVTLDAASGSPRVDIIEAQVTSIADKEDITQTATVASGTAISVTNLLINRDIKYYLSVRKQTNTTSTTAATTATLTGTVAIPGTIDLSEKYLLNLQDTEDGSYQEIDLRGATPEATTKAEIISALNTATGRTAASTGGGDVIVFEGSDSGETSYFEIKPPVTDSDKDALEVVFGVSIGGVYKYKYQGDNEWFKLAEIDVGASTTTISNALIRNINRKDTWASESQEVIVHDTIYKKNISEWNKYSSIITYSKGDVSFINGNQYVSLKDTNTDNYPITSPNYWEICKNLEEIIWMYHSGLAHDSGFKNIDNPRETSDYEQNYFYGYYEEDGISYEAYKVHLDGTQLTGDTDLEYIFDVGGSNEYFNIDIIAPDVVGTRTLFDTKGLTRTYVDAPSGVRENICVRQEDAFQGHDRDSGINYAPTFDASLKDTGVVRRGASGASSTIANGTTVGAYFDDGVNGTPRTDSETRMVNFSDGIPFIMVLKKL